MEGPDFKDFERIEIGWPCRNRGTGLQPVWLVGVAKHHAAIMGCYEPDRRHVPDRPPDFDSRRMGPIVMPRSTTLHMS